MPDGAPTPSRDPLVSTPDPRADQGRQHGPTPPHLHGRRLYHSLFAWISPHFRGRRMQAFAEAMGLRGTESILDLGGGPSVWHQLDRPSLRVTLLNPEPPVIRPEIASRHPHLVAVAGDATRLSYAPGDFDIVFSNSVIEHLHSLDRQRQFAAEALRVAGTTGGLWIQTPARSFFIEPHFLTIGLHWLPKRWQFHLLPWLSLWGWTRRPSPEMTRAWLEEIRLMTARELRQLFPGCQLRREKFLGLWTKSFIVCRRPLHP